MTPSYMGATESIYCANCKDGYGERAILNISQPGSNRDGYNLCIECYEKGNKMSKKIIMTKHRTCYLCKYKSNKTDPVFLIHWYGKLGGIKICHPCLFLQKYKYKN